MIGTRTEPDINGLAWKLVEGWWCPCVGPGADVGHHSSGCAQRIRIQEWVATYPRWRMPVWRRAGARDDGSENTPEDRAPFVACRDRIDSDPMPPAARRMLALVGERTFRLTYAKGWGRKLVLGAGDGGKGKYLPWPVESVALRVGGVCAVTWARREGEKAWSVEAAYAVWEGRIWPVNVTAVASLLRSLDRS